MKQCLRLYKVSLLNDLDVLLARLTEFRNCYFKFRFELRLCQIAIILLCDQDKPKIEKQDLIPRKWFLWFGQYNGEQLEHLTLLLLPFVFRGHARVELTSLIEFSVELEQKQTEWTITNRNSMDASAYRSTVE